MNNVIESELFKFSDLASEWWNPDGKMKPLHKINPARLQYIQTYTTLNNTEILDVGCGGGLLSEALARCGAKVTGIDISEALITVAKNHAYKQELKIDYHCTNIEILEKLDKRFDLITCMELLEHVPNPLDMIKSCATLIKPGGKVFFSTINRNFKSYLFAIVGAEYLLNWLPKGTHNYMQFIRPSELTQWAKTSQLQLLDITGIQYRPFKKEEFCLGPDISVNYLACFEKKSHD